MENSEEQQSQDNLFRAGMIFPPHSKEYKCALAAAKKLVRFCQCVAGDQAHEGTLRTPDRVVRALMEQCYPDEFDFTTFLEPGANNLVVVKQIPFTSLCEHHMMAFEGVAHIGYIPCNGVIVGLSKLPRLLMHFAAGLNTQERITQKVGTFLAENKQLNPSAVAVIIEARHTCMESRGVKAHGALTRTQFFFGLLANDPSSKAEFMAAIK